MFVPTMSWGHKWHSFGGMALLHFHDFIVETTFL